MKRIVYIGSKEQKGDNVAGTGLVWTRGEIKEVLDDKKAELLLKHTRVWADADTKYEMQPEISLVEKPEPKVSIIPTEDVSPFWEPVVIPVPPEVFAKLQTKDLVAVFMSNADADAFAVWKAAQTDTAPKNTGPKKQDKETKPGLEGKKAA